MSKEYQTVLSLLRFNFFCKLMIDHHIMVIKEGHGDSLPPDCFRGNIYIEEKNANSSVGPYRNK